MIALTHSHGGLPAARHPTRNAVAFAASVVGEALLRQRVRLYFQVLCFIHLGFLACCALVTLVVGPQLEAGSSPVLDALGYGLPVALLLAWLFVSQVPIAPSWLLVFETAGTVLLCTAYVQLNGAANPESASPAGVMLVAMALVLRAALIPSTVTRTLGVGLLCVLTASICAARSDDALAPAQLGHAVLGTAFVAVTGVTSFVIYGLNRAVQAARRLGPYQLEQKLGEGGMAVVYRAKHVLLGRTTAVKLLPPDRIGERSLARFEREVRQTSRLSHPNNVHIYECGRTDDGIFYYAMEYLDGLNLEQLVESTGPLHPARVVHILRQVARALAEAHGIGLVHRDVKPANIMLCDRGHMPDMVKLLDFGLVKELWEPNPSLSGADTILGTPHYLAPEVIAHPDAASTASDVYALGAVAYYLLTGRRVFEGSTFVGVCSRHLSEQPVPPSKMTPGMLDACLEAIVLRCLAKRPLERYESGAELARALDAIDLDGWSAADAQSWWRSHAKALSVSNEGVLPGTARAST